MLYSCHHAVIGSRCRDLGVVALLPAGAEAQAPSASAGDAPGAPPPAAAASVEATGTDSASPRPVVPATGYGWSSPTPEARPARLRPRPKGGVSGAVMPGFETEADGSTRLFVELSKPVNYETKKARGSVTYVLKGAYVERTNNLNALETVHFNTPVLRARLVAHGADLWFVVELRADVPPDATMDTRKDGTAVLHLDFPKGDYVKSSPAPEASSSSGPGDSAAVRAVEPHGSSVPAATHAPAVRGSRGSSSRHHRGGGPGGSPEELVSRPDASLLGAAFPLSSRLVPRGEPIPGCQGACYSNRHPALPDRWERMEREDGKGGRIEDGTEQVVGALVEVHRTLGPGLPELACPSTSSTPSSSRPRCGA